MRLWGMLLALMVAGFGREAVAQDLTIPLATYPSLATSAATVAGFVPTGWGLESQASGDLNRDGVADLVLVLRGRDPHLVLANTTGLGEDHVDSNPRILAVLFAQPGGGYRLAASSRQLIPRMEDPNLADYLENGEVTAQGSALHVSMGLWYSSGSWEMSNIAYTFRYQHGRFELIGYDHTTTSRSSGAMQTVSINYSTRGVVRETGNISDDTPGPQRRSRLPPRPTVDLEHIGSGIDFDPGVPAE